MPAKRSTIKGGKKLKAFLRNAARSSRKPQPTAEAGFLEPHVARLAARLEFGDPRSSLPERPAFRMSRDDAMKAGRVAIVDALGKETRTGRFAVADTAAKVAADAMAETIRGSYETFHGAPTSERQEARKRGTPGAGRQLVGHEGPKLIGHIKGRVVKGRDGTG